MQAEVPTRSARKEETRRRLLDATLALVAEKGFASASLAEIAARAGLTTGAVYSNFRSKEALLLELVEWRMDAMPTDPATYPPPDQPGKPVLQHLVDTVVAAARFIDTEESRQLAVLQLELFLLALRDDSVRREWLSGGHAVTAGLVQVLGHLEDVPNPGPPPSLEQLAHVFYATVQGLQQYRLLEPEHVPDEVFEWAVRALLFAASNGRRTRRSRAAVKRASRGAVSRPRTR